MFLSVSESTAIEEIVESCCSDDDIEMQEVEISTAAFLQGAYIPEEGVMRTKLNDLGYLPGQKPKAFFATATQSGHPYSKAPWNYAGKEGLTKGSNPFQYPADVVDWVLVSLRSEDNITENICQQSAFINKKGLVQLSNGAPNCEVDINKKYYIVIEHRNHLAVMSNEPVAIRNGKLSYDFRYATSYEDGQEEIAKNTYAMIAGNAKKADSIADHKFIDEEDIKSWEGANGMNSSYFQMDLDLSGDVSIKDQELIYNNLGRFSTVPF